jgi:hypothetical protein
VGQGRTFIVCRDDDPGRIDVADACRNLRAGRALVSLGLLCDITIDARYHVGDLASQLGAELRVTVRVLGPLWTRADHVALYSNGFLVREAALEPSTAAGEKARITWQLPRPAHDVAVVAIASGPGVTGLFAATPRPYQPSSPAWRPRVIGATNPIRVDGDGDGLYASPRAQAEAVITRTGTQPEALVRGLAPFDEAVATQAADLCQATGQDVRNEAFSRALSQSAEPVRRGFAAFTAASASPPATGGSRDPGGLRQED